MPDIWSWVLTAFLLTVLYMTGKKIRAGWIVGIVSQIIWLVYAITTKQYGFLVGVILVGGMYVKNWIDWGKDPAK
jgi:hypothetical protein